MENKEDISLSALIASEQFQKYCLSPEQVDLDYWDQWKREHGEHLQVFEEAKKWVFGLASQVSDTEIKSEFHKVLNQSESSILSTSKPHPPIYQWMGLAAGILVLCAIFLFWQSNRSPELQLYATDFGETQSVTLPDGSHVMLNANSSLKLASEWSNQQREIWLDGEGFFEIKHDPSNPFIVHTSKGDIKVLGTSFNAFQRAEKLSVTLIEGKVNLAFEGLDEEISMKPGEQVIINQSKISHERIDIEPVIAWKLGHLLFRDATIESIIERLRVEFNLEIEVAETSILQKRIHAVIHQYDPEVLLNALAEIYDLDIEKQGERSFRIK